MPIIKANYNSDFGWKTERGRASDLLSDPSWVCQQHIVLSLLNISWLITRESANPHPVAIKRVRTVCQLLPWETASHSFKF